MDESGARVKDIKQNPHRLYRRGGSKEGNGLGELNAHLVDLSTQTWCQGTGERNLVFIRVLGNQAPEKLTVIRRDF